METLFIIGPLVTDGNLTWRHNKTNDPVGQISQLGHTPYPNADGSPRPIMRWKEKAVSAQKENGEVVVVGIVIDDPTSSGIPITNDQRRLIKGL